MPLTPQQVTQAWAALQGRLNTCPICASANWHPAEIIIGLPYTTGGVVLGGPTIPLLLVVCTNCKYVAQFAAVPLGLVQ